MYKYSYYSSDKREDRQIRNILNKLNIEDTKILLELKPVFYLKNSVYFIIYWILSCKQFLESREKGRYNIETPDVGTHKVTFMFDSRD